MTYPTAFVAHPACAEHDTGWAHPEHQGRLPAVVRALEKDTLALLEHVLQREAIPASESALRRVHTAGHVEAVRDAVRRARAAKDGHAAIDAETIVSAASWDAALASVGTVLTAIDLVLNGEAATAFAASRPPGHHATPERAMGFCLFNNVAIGARHALERGLERVLIVDWDVHHGNGTQEAFYDDPAVYYLSTHLWPHYPGTGAADERGTGAGTGTTRNVPLDAGTSAQRYHDRFEAALDATLAEFEADLVLVSAGFDCLDGDPLGGLRLEPSDLHRVTRRLLDATRSSAAGRMVVALEGGYAPPRLGAGVVDVVRALVDLPAKD